MPDPHITGAERIAAERQRQIADEGWTAGHDDSHDTGHLVRAGVAYALASLGEAESSAHWPWANEWKPSSDPVKSLVRAGALIAAEIDRLLRLTNAGHHPPDATDEFPRYEQAVIRFDERLTNDDGDTASGWLGLMPDIDVSRDA